MKKLLFTLLLLTSPISFAQEAKGVIEEIQICATGLSSNNWIRTLQFKIDGKWFATWADHYNKEGGYDNTISTSMVYMAYSQKLPVHIKATESWHDRMKKCGASEGAIFHALAGDFIRISR
ncbi:hypothetical protein [Vibrio sp.]|uniref:hypothetical protein n=1 Tax=Vibrio sp. TaxID=678 RepID=UPI00311DB210